MSSPSDILGPELEGLLREAAADPRSQLLRVPRPARVEGLLERQAVLRSSATGLTRLDRHLLAVYRAELADLLLRACTVQVSLDEGIRLYVQWSRTSTADVPVDSIDEWKAHAAASTTLGVDDHSAMTAHSLIKDCVRSEVGIGSPSITQLARAAARLQRSARAEAWVAFDQAHHGDSAIATRLAKQLLSECPGHLVAVTGYEILGLLHARAGRPDLAAGAYRDAFVRAPDHAAAIIGWMHFAIQAVDDVAAAQAGRLLEELVVDPRPSLLALMGNYSRQKAAGDFIVSVEQKQLANKLAVISGPVPGKVLDVYL